MLRLVGPCKPHKRNEFKAKLDLLQEYFGDKYGIGIEVFGHWDDCLDPVLAEATKKNLNDLLPKSAVVSLHAPFPDKRHPGMGFFGSSDEFANLIKVLDFADELEADLINMHTSLFLSYQKLKELYENGMVESYKESLVLRVKKALERLQTEMPERKLHKICVENVIYNFEHNSTLNPAEMNYEIDFVDPADFLKIIDPKKRIYATIDVCHLACAYDSSQLLEKIKMLGNGLGHVHFSDVQQMWVPFVQLGKEGGVPGTGKIGERVGKELFAYFLEISKKRDLSIVFEIYDDDYSKLDESRKSFGIIREWLDELDR